MKKIMMCLVAVVTITVGFALINGCAPPNETATPVEENIQKEEEPKMDPQEQAEIASQTDTSLPAGAQVAILETSKGKIVFKFFPEKAPGTLENFIKLAQSGFYDGTRFHRVEPGFVVQGGDPNSKDDDPNNDGRGGPGYTIKAEFNDLRHLTGTVAMARSDPPDSAGSQFYICLAPQPDLDGRYTIFGQVIEGMDIVLQIQIGDTLSKVTIETR